MEPAIIVIQKDGVNSAKRGCLATFLIWAAALGWTFYFHRFFEAGSTVREWGGYIAAGLLIFICPGIGILQALELKSAVDWEDGSLKKSLLWRLLIFAGCWLCGAVCLGTGVMPVLAALDPADGTAHSSLARIGMGLFSLPFLALAFFLFRHPFKRREGSTCAEDLAAYEERQRRLANPDFAGLETATGARLPPAYVQLLAPGSTWVENELWLHPEGEDGPCYSVFERLPAHSDSLRQHPHLPGPFLAFAQGEDGEYWIQLGIEDPPVFLHRIEPDSGEARHENICGHFSQFLAWPAEEV